MKLQSYRWAIWCRAGLKIPQRDAMSAFTYESGSAFGRACCSQFDPRRCRRNGDFRRDHQCRELYRGSKDAWNQ
ncbi:hypothetical protein GLA29479_4660 [Lysobacter antibioticus]|nr:hypothetical protein GLA29479_4660 [Lysobacter antibioticus]